MRTQVNGQAHKLLVSSILFALVLAGCAPSEANITPTLSMDAIFTVAAETMRAQEATQLALTPPTDTPSPSPFPTLPPASPLPTLSIASSTPGGVSACDNMAYVSDVTIPDGTTLKPGEKFTKTWKIYNSGSCNWTTSYKLAFASGEPMSGATTVLPAQVNSGSQADISVALTAPTTNGTFRSNWRMQNASGQSFGNVIYVEIKVGAGSTVTPGPSPTGGPTATGGSTFILSGNTQEGSGTTVTCVGKNENKPTVVATVDNNGNYSCTVPLHWAGTIEPVKGTWTFTPQFVSPIDDVTANMSGLDFTATH
jgi:hypothetical protein